MEGEVHLVEETVHDQTVYFPSDGDDGHGHGHGHGRDRHFTSEEDRVEEYHGRIESILRHGLFLCGDSSFRADNFCHRDAIHTLQGDAGAILGALRKVADFSNATPAVVCAVFRITEEARAAIPRDKRKERSYQKFVFCNFSHLMAVGGKVFDQVRGMGYHVARAQQSHTVMQMIQFLHFHSKYYDLMAFCPSNPLCSGCQVVLSAYCKRHEMGSAEDALQASESDCQRWDTPPALEAVLRDVGMLPGIVGEGRDAALLRAVEDLRRRLVDSMASGRTIHAVAPLPTYHRQRAPDNFSWRKYSSLTLDDFRKLKAWRKKSLTHEDRHPPSFVFDVKHSTAGSGTLSKHHRSSQHYLEELIRKQESQLRQLADLHSDRMDLVLEKLRQLDQATRALRESAQANHLLSATTIPRLPRSPVHIPSFYGYTPQSAQHSNIQFDSHYRQYDETTRDIEEVASPSYLDWEPDLSHVPRPRRDNPGSNSPSPFGYTPEDAIKSLSPERREVEIWAI